MNQQMDNTKDQNPEGTTKIVDQREALAKFPEKIKYLVVEDDFTLQPIWEHIIRTVDSHAIIRWARTEEGAERLIHDRERIEDQFDIVIADIVLAGEKNGIDLWKQFKNNDMLFLFNSGMPEKKFSLMLNEDPDDYPFFVNKPLDIRECIHILGALLQYRRASKGEKK